MTCVASDSGKGWTLYQGDCVEILSALDLVADHVITDPPYEAAAHSKGRRLRASGANLGASEGRAVTEAPIPFDAMTEQLRDAVSVELARKCKRWCLVFCQAEGAHLWDASIPLRSMRWCVWTKPDAQPQFTGDRPGVGYETIVTKHPPGRARWNGGGRVGVFHHAKYAYDGARNDHPTQKPVSLMMELVTLFTDPGEMVLDAFAGSGSTGVACLRAGRRFVGIEKDPNYFALAVERLRAEEQGSTLHAARAGQMALLGGTK